MEQAIDEMVPGEVIVVFFDCMEMVVNRLLEFGAIALEAPEPRPVLQHEHAESRNSIPLSV